MDGGSSGMSSSSGASDSSSSSGGAGSTGAADTAGSHAASADAPGAAAADQPSTADTRQDGFAAELQAYLTSEKEPGDAPPAAHQANAAADHGEIDAPAEDHGELDPPARDHGEIDGDDQGELDPPGEDYGELDPPGQDLGELDPQSEDLGDIDPPTGTAVVSPDGVTIPLPTEGRFHNGDAFVQKESHITVVGDHTHGYHVIIDNLGIGVNDHDERQLIADLVKGLAQAAAKDLGVGLAGRTAIGGPVGGIAGLMVGAGASVANETTTHSTLGDGTHVTFTVLGK